LEQQQPGYPEPGHGVYLPGVLHTKQDQKYHNAGEDFVCSKAKLSASKKKKRKRENTVRPTGTSIHGVFRISVSCPSPWDHSTIGESLCQYHKGSDMVHMVVG